MGLLHNLSYVTVVAALGFLVLSVASGLLWISELIEEHSKAAKLIGKRGIYAIILIHILLFVFDSLPGLYLLFSICCHVVYLQNFTITWPLVSLTSGSFISSCLLVVVDHFLWFFYFSRITHEARQTRGRMYRGPQSSIPGFADIATFFAICVWLAPLFLFLSLSAADNTLPTSTGTPSTPANAVHNQSRASLFRTLVDTLPTDRLPLMKPKMARRASEGIIAPCSPAPSRLSGGPPPSPGLRALNDIPQSPQFITRRSSETLSPGFQLSPPPRRVSSPASRMQEGVRVGLGLRRLTSDSGFT